MTDELLDPVRRMRIMCDAYGLDDERLHLVPVILKRVERIIEWISAAQRDGRAVKAELVNGLPMLNRTRAYIAREKSRIEASL